MNVAAPLPQMVPRLARPADPEESVAAGREALDCWWGYPWYDAQTDALRRVDVSEPWDWSWLWNWLPDSLFPFGVPDTFLGWVAWTAIVLLLVGLVYLLARAYRDRKGHPVDSSTEAESPQGKQDADRVADLPFPIRHGRRDLLGEARQYYRQGDFAQAIIYLFSFQLVQLDKRQIVRLAKGKTNRQYLREVGPRRTLHRLVEQTMVAFEDVFFGNHTLDRARFESCWSRLEEFESLAGEGAG